jgi:uncharacterized tellurite resistance protein B-like protein
MDDPTIDQELRRRVCRLIAGIVVSDDDLDEAEDKFIDRLLPSFGIPIEERESIFPIVDRAEAAEALRALPKSIHREVFDLLLDAAVADGKVVDEEKAYLHTVGEVLGLAAAEVDGKIADRLKAPRPA